MAKTIIGTVTGGILFTWIFGDPEGLLVGMVLGFLLSKNSVHANRLGRMEKRLEEYEKLNAVHREAAKRHEPSTPVETTTGETTTGETTTGGKNQDQVRQKTPHAAPVQAPAAAPASPPVSSSTASGSSVSNNTKEKSANGNPAPSTSAPTYRNPVDTVIAYIWNFFTQGNVVLRVGLLVLFFGVSFLLKYAVERSMLSIELRLFGVALAGIAMLLFGWRLRLQRAGFALLMQGGGIGLLFLTVFAASKLYHLLPMPLAFAVMAGLVCTSAALALLQDARSLALFGATGGFLAPVLLSTGTGNHVALFSYYALLNTGILAIAWFKAWRELNLLGFVFTLGIGSFWGVSSYKAQYFFSTEPFLILFFLMFTIIGVLFAFRQPPKLRGYVDGTLVFGTPIICFSLQAALVKNMPYGLAISALAVSLFYIVLAMFLWNKGNERLRQGMRSLTEAFLALGIIFVTLAVPLALSGRWTAVTWAMEGAALIWIGVRQHRIIPRNFGIVLQLTAAFFFLAGNHPADERMILLNGAYLGSLIISLSALFSSWYLYQAENLRGFERYHHLLLFIWGVIWWFGGGIEELNYQVPYFYQDYVVLFFIGLSCAAMITLAGRISWPIAAWPGLGLLPVMGLVTMEKIGWHGFFGSQHLFADLGWLAWPAAFTLLHYCLYLGREQLREQFLRLIHIGGYLLLILMATSEVAWLVHSFTSGVGAWNLIVWGLVPAAMLWLVQNGGFTRFWPLSVYAGQYQERGSAVMVVLLWVWLLAGSLLNPGNAEPLPFIPVFNPLELSQLIVLLMLFRWILLRRNYVTSLIPLRAFGAVGGATAFILINAALARAVHHLVDVPFYLDSMLDSRLYQTALSILWGILSLMLMVTADRRSSRIIWFTGSILIGATVCKLFLVDLINSGTVERIVSFLAVGILLMIIGYFSPLPPAQDRQDTQGKQEKK